MAIGTAAAILGSAVIGGVVSSSAASKAAKASQTATDQSTQLLREQNAQTRADLAPYNQAGVSAIGALNDRLGVGPKPAAPAQGGINTQAYFQAYPDVAQGYQQAKANGYQGDEAAFANEHFQTYGKSEGRTAEMMPTTPAAPATQPVDPGTFGQTQNPTYQDPAPYQAPAYQAPREFSYTAEDYKASPAYQYTVDQAMKGVLASSAATGALQSGAALKALQDRASNLAYQDFGNERAFAFNRYTDNRNFGRGSYETDRNYGRSTYETDRAYGRGNYETDRNYLTNRFDNQTNNLFQLGQMGQASAAQTASAGANTTTGIVNALNNNAANKGNAAIAGANSFNNFLQSGVSALSYQQGQNALKTGSASRGAYSNPYASQNLWT